VITPTGPVTGDDLYLSYKYSDPDNNEEGATSIEWYKNGVIIMELTNEKVVPSTHTAKGDSWYAVITPWDDYIEGEALTSGVVTIANSVPEVLDLAISPTVPVEGEVLLAIYTYLDDDDDPETGSIITWYKNDEALMDYNGKIFIPGSLVAGGDSWYFTITPSDGERGMTGTSDVTVINSRPLVTEVELYPTEPTSTATLEVTYEYFDADGDTEQGTMVVWLRNGEHITQLDNRLIVDASLINVGDIWSVKVIPSDGFQFGDEVQVGSSEIKGDAPQVVEDPDDPSSKVSATSILLILLILIIVTILILLFARRRKESEDEISQIDEDFGPAIKDDKEEGSKEDGQVPPEVLFCPDCGQEVDEGEGTCPACGAEFIDEIEFELECPQCGAEVNTSGESWPNCPECGTELELEEELTDEQEDLEPDTQLPKQQGDDEYPSDNDIEMQEDLDDDNIPDDDMGKEEDLIEFEEDPPENVTETNEEDYSKEFKEELDIEEKKDEHEEDPELDDLIEDGGFWDV